MDRSSRYQLRPRPSRQERRHRRHQPPAAQPEQPIPLATPEQSVVDLAGSATTECLNLMRRMPAVTPFASAGCKRKLKYRQMIVRALQMMNGQCKPQSLGKIVKYLECRYKVRNDFVVKCTLDWMRCKGMVKVCDGKYKLLTTRVKLCKSPIFMKRKKGRRSCRKRKRKRRRGGCKKRKRRRCPAKRKRRRRRCR